jgi:hypothetical protein
MIETARELDRDQVFRLVESYSFWLEDSIIDVFLESSSLLQIRAPSV